MSWLKNQRRRREEQRSLAVGDFVEWRAGRRSKNEGSDRVNEGFVVEVAGELLTCQMANGKRCRVVTSSATRIPTPEEICSRSAEVRGGWTANDLRSRRGLPIDYDRVEIRLVKAADMGLDMKEGNEL
jgi:hypothetical protein